jgi:DNA topoisomerase-6 subunit B
VRATQLVLIEGGRKGEAAATPEAAARGKKPARAKKPTAAKKPARAKKPTAAKKPARARKPTTAKKPARARKPSAAKTARKRTRAKRPPVAEKPNAATSPTPSVEVAPLPELLPTTAAPAAGGGGSRRRSASEMATRQREISVSEFFTKNRHLLGFDNPSKALLTTVKEAVDNSFDACEEAGILPDITISILEISETRYRVVVEDNGPGIVRSQIPKVFGQLLYGSKFHRLRQSRGQQGIGISAAGMYGQLTTGKPIIITSRTGPKRPAHHFEIQIDTRRNLPVVMRDDVVEWATSHGTRVELEIEATYKKGRHSVDGYVEMTALSNPHATLTFHSPKGEASQFERSTTHLPREPKEIKPHPHGIELGMCIPF